MKVLTHEERLALIHRPFFIRQLPISYPYGGCAVTDNFFNPGAREWAERPRPSGEVASGSWGPGHILWTNTVGSLSDLVKETEGLNRRIPGRRTLVDDVDA